jgi:hypothetical protein
MHVRAHVETDSPAEPRPSDEPERAGHRARLGRSESRFAIRAGAETSACHGSRPSERVPGEGDLGPDLGMTAREELATEARAELEAGACFFSLRLRFGADARAPRFSDRGRVHPRASPASPRRTAPPSSHARARPPLAPQPTDGLRPGSFALHRGKTRRAPPRALQFTMLTIAARRRNFGNRAPATALCTFHDYSGFSSRFSSSDVRSRPRKLPPKRLETTSAARTS